MRRISGDKLDIYIARLDISNTFILNVWNRIYEIVIRNITYFCGVINKPISIK